jgi:hypothetical protein
MIYETIKVSGTDGVVLEEPYYGTIGEANAYFGMRLHEFSWSESQPNQRPRALWAATQLIDQLNFKGERHDGEQALEFPRGTDEEVPRAIRFATYELAHSLLEGRVPEDELEALGINSTGYSSVRTTFNRNQVPIEHLINGIPNMVAWRYIRPFLRDSDAIKISRV